MPGNLLKTELVLKSSAYIEFAWHCFGIFFFQRANTQAS